MEYRIVFDNTQLDTDCYHEKFSCGTTVGIEFNNYYQKG